MSKQERTAPEAEPQVSKSTQQFFYPPQDGREAVVIDASSKEEADALYSQSNQ